MCSHTLFNPAQTSMLAHRYAKYRKLINKSHLGQVAKALKTKSF